MSDEKIDLVYVVRALDRLIDEVGTMREQMIVQGAIINRLDNNVANLAVEVRAIRSLLDRALDRIRKAELRVDKLEGAQ